MKHNVILSILCLSSTPLYMFAMELDEYHPKDMLASYTRVPRDVRRLLGNAFQATEDWYRVPTFGPWYIRHIAETYCHDETYQLVPFMFGKNNNKVYRRKKKGKKEVKFLTDTIGCHSPFALFDVIGPNEKGTLACQSKACVKGKTHIIQPVVGQHTEVLGLQNNKNRIVAKRSWLNQQAVYVFDYEKGPVVRTLHLPHATYISTASITDDDRVLVAYFDPRIPRYCLCIAEYPALMPVDCSIAGSWLPPEMSNPIWDSIEPDQRERKKVIAYINAIMLHPVYQNMVVLELVPRIMKRSTQEGYRVEKTAGSYHYLLYHLEKRNGLFLPITTHCADGDMVELRQFFSQAHHEPPLRVQFGDTIALNRAHLVRLHKYACRKKRPVIRVKKSDDNDWLYCVLLVAWAKRWLSDGQSDVQEGKQILAHFYDTRFITHKYKLLWQCTQEHTNPFKQLYQQLYPSKLMRLKSSMRAIMTRNKSSCKE